MNERQACDEESRHTNAERYAAHRMSVQEAAAFEDHFVTCPDCQDEVRLASAIMAGLERGSAVDASAKSRRRVWLGGGLVIAAGLAALAVLTIAPRRELVALGGVREPPAYLGIPVRGAGAAQDSVFGAAMELYAARRYATAAAELRIALAAGGDSVPAEFFLAVSLLLDNRPDEAADAFQRVLARGDTPYRAEARYYRAKALLRVNRRAEAQAELAKLTSTDGIVYGMARALADSIERLARR